MHDDAARLLLQLSSEADTAALAGVLAGVLAPGDVVLLSGELGAGKTTLTRLVVGHLGGDVAATSPTFTLCHLYATRPPIAHVDCWRLDTVHEIADLDLDELLDEGYALVIEWGERARRLVGDDALLVELALDPARGDEARAVAISASGPRAHEALRALARATARAGLRAATDASGARAR